VVSKNGLAIFQLKKAKNWEKHNNLLIIPNFKMINLIYFFVINNKRNSIQIKIHKYTSLERFEDRNFNNGLLLLKLTKDKENKLDTKTFI
jgi:hypothetical protein